MYSHTGTLCLCAEPLIFVLVRRIWIESSIIAHILLIFNIFIFLVWRYFVLLFEKRIIYMGSS